jgi:L-seryl-tRNA(Ser) seleniumtransferase
VDAPPAQSPSALASDLPSVDRLLGHPSLQPLLATAGRSRVTAALRTHLEALRRQALAGQLPASALTDQAIAAAVEAIVAADDAPRLRPVYNLTGTVLHTNLGRALLPDEAVRAVVQVMACHVNLEYDLTAGRRGDRDSHVADVLRELTGAEAATVVNNNAAAVLLMLAALGRQREVVISRGELIEIGDSFRIPDIMRQAGVKLVEVGTTNRTHLADYAQAIGPRTALLMKAHTSNYAITGFTSSVSTEDLAQLGRTHGVPVAVDLGSGSLVELERWRLPSEPTVRATVAAGADLVTFSGDKLLGGPQAGIVVGRAELIDRLKRHPLKRALRTGKLTLAALEAVLALYRTPERLAERLTALRLLTRPAGAMQAQAERLLPVVQRALGDAYVVTATALLSQIGSGALPVDRLPSYGLAVRRASRGRGSLDRLEAALRALPKPVIGRIADKALWLDLRCLEEPDEADFARQWSALGP